jgi:hypothetical protein
MIINNVQLCYQCEYLKSKGLIKIFFCIFVLVFFAAHASSAESQTVHEDSTLKIRVGAAYRFNTRTSAVWDRSVVDSQFSRYYRSSSDSPDIGSLGEYADRDYEDGYVNIDQGTADPETYRIGYTWFWGYEEEQQYSGNSVAFHTAPVNEVYVAPVEILPWSEDHEIDQAGLDIALERRLAAFRNFHVSLLGGVSWYPQRDQHFETRREIARQKDWSWRIVDTYSAPYKPFPEAPYSGDLPGPGYLIKNIPSSRENQVLSESSRSLYVNSKMDFSMSVLDIRLGPNMVWVVNDRLHFSLSPQLRIAHIDADIKEKTVFDSLSGEKKELNYNAEEKDWIIGYGGEVKLDYYLYKSLFLSVSALADVWSEDAEFSGQAYDLNIELGTWTVTTAVGWEF